MASRDQQLTDADFILGQPHDNLSLVIDAFFKEASPADHISTINQMLSSALGEKGIGKTHIQNTVFSACIISEFITRLYAVRMEQKQKEVCHA